MRLTALTFALTLAAAHAAPSSQPTTPSAAPAGLARASDADIDARVGAAKARLSATPAGQKMWAAIEAHGGLKAWFSRGPVAFRFDYRPMDAKGTHRDTRQVVDTWSARAVHTMPEGKARFGWDGQRAWVHPAGADVGKAPRFWALTPYYFIAAPFVFADPGVRLADEGPIEWEGRKYDQVRVTYEAGVGDAPKDFYVVYLDAETHRVGGLRYIVSYPGFFPDGGHTPEKWMAYDGEQVVDGIKFAKTFRTFAWDAEKKVPGPQVTAITLSEVAFAPDTPAAAFAAPAGADVLTGY